MRTRTPNALPSHTWFTLLRKLGLCADVLLGRTGDAQRSCQRLSCAAPAVAAVWQLGGIPVSRVGLQRQLSADMVQLDSFGAILIVQVGLRVELFCVKLCLPFKEAAAALQFKLGSVPWERLASQGFCTVHTTSRS